MSKARIFELPRGSTAYVGAMVGRLVLVAGLTALLAFSSTISAAPGTRAGRQPGVTQDDLEEIRRIVRTDEVQNELIQALFDGYQESFGDGMETMRQRLNEIREQARSANKPDIWRQISPQLQAVQNEWNRDAAKLEQAFFEEVRQLLTHDQAGRWHIFERERRRRTTLSDRTYVRLKGEGVDLILLVEAVNPPKGTMDSLGSTLEHYAEDLDEALVVRNRIVDETNSKLNEMAQTRRFGEAQALFDQSHRARIVLRDVNVRYCDTLASLMPVPYARQMRNLFLMESFPRIFRPTQAERYIDTVAELEDLTANQQSGLDSIKKNFLQQIAPINNELMELEKKRELDTSVIYAQMASPAGDGSGATSAEAQQRNKQRSRQQRDLWLRRRRLETAMMDQVFSMLTPSQQALAPKGRTRPYRSPLDRGRPTTSHSGEDH